jgi:hypothetical protein
MFFMKLYSRQILEWGFYCVIVEELKEYWEKMSMSKNLTDKLR